MAELPFQIPAEVINWIRSVFAVVNRRVSDKLTRIPTTHETSLDITFIEELSQHSAPFRFSSSWVVRLETHYRAAPGLHGFWPELLGRNLQIREVALGAGSDP